MHNEKSYHKEMFMRSSKFDLEKFLIAQKNWSQKTFGPDQRISGIIKHIKKELKEVEDNPAELVDVVLLALDGLWRHGMEPREICNALESKFEENQSRSWPDWREMDPDQAIEHKREEEI